MTMSSSKTIIISFPKYVDDQHMGIPIKVESSGLTTGFDVKPTLANVTYDNINDDTSFSDMLFSSSKKRRLDHLSYEQKLQRKKLKNRVAAQCSRDRKKARLDELEIENKLLKETNDALLAHCDELKMKNEELTTENKDLYSKLSSRQTRDVGCSPIVGPAAMEDPYDLPSLPDLLGDIVTDDYMSQLEELAVSLLREATASCEEGKWESAQAACGNAESAETPKVSGGEPEDMGPSPMACDHLAATNSCHQDLLPTIHIPDTRETFRETCEPLRDDVNEIITITLPCKGMVCVEDAVQEVVTSELGEAVSPLFSDTHSPIPHSPLLYTPGDIATFSDCGYESLDSPYSEDSTNSGLTDLWNESFSDLFPSLI
uniref:X-box-binding protein 1 n=1 Tax=Timema tahoe TaxID=61484 RepID=A0A7R9ICD0_9NEOP|nr:unnamed protein product [Timema tahoe]